MGTIGPIEFKSKSGRSFTIRSFQDVDEEKEVEFVNQVSKETTHTLKKEGLKILEPHQLRQIYQSCLEHPVNLYLGCWDGQHIVGKYKLLQRAPNHPWIKHIAAFAMAVSKAYWRDGIGSKLLKLGEERAGSSGITRIEAEVRCANEAGISFYEHAGYKIEGKREHAALINGKFEDEYYIAKLF